MNYLKYILLLIVGVSTGCKSQDTPSLRLISAEKEHWLGGVNGVEGYHFSVRVATPSKEKVEFLNLHWQGETLPVTTEKKKDHVEVKASYSWNRNEPQLNISTTGMVEVPQKNQKEKTTYLTFKIKNKTDTLMIPKFVEKTGSQPLFP